MLYTVEFIQSHCYSRLFDFALSYSSFPCSVTVNFWYQFFVQGSKNKKKQHKNKVQKCSKNCEFVTKKSTISSIKAQSLRLKLYRKLAHARWFFKDIFIARSGRPLFVENLSLVISWKSKVLLHKQPCKNVLKSSCTYRYMLNKIHSCSLYSEDWTSNSFTTII